MQSLSSSVGYAVGLISRCALFAEGLAEAAVQFRGGQIAACDGSPIRGMIDYGDLLILPGIVGLHDDAFERTVTPRPGVAFPYETALADVDGQLLTCGIATGLHGVTYFWEGGLCDRTYAVHTFDTPDAMRSHLGTQHLIHLRFELHHTDGVANTLTWMDVGHAHSLSFNDHLPMMHGKPGDARKLAQYADRAECDIDTFLTHLNAAAVSATRLNEMIDTLAQAAQ